MSKHIVLTSDSIKSVLADHKTQMRKVMRPQPEESKMRWNGKRWECNLGYPMGHGLPKCPYGQIGDKLWVKEKIKIADRELSLIKRGYWTYRVRYMSDNSLSPYFWACTTSDYPTGKIIHPSIMPRWASRISLLIVDLWIEPLHDITDREVVREGLASLHEIEDSSVYYEGSLVETFKVVWNATNEKKCSWSSNPWVWVISFHRCE